MSLIVLIAVGCIAVFVLLVVGMKAVPEMEGDDRMKNVYIYLVLFATLMMTIGGSISIFMSAADILSPAAYHQTFEEYKTYSGEKAPQIAGQPPVKLSEQELLANYNAMIAAEKERQVQRAKNSLVKSLGWIVIPLPVFLYFQRRLVKKDTV